MSEREREFEGVGGARSLSNQLPRQVKIQCLCKSEKENAIGMQLSFAAFKHIDLRAYK